MWRAERPTWGSAAIAAPRHLGAGGSGRGDPPVYLSCGEPPWFSGWEGSVTCVIRIGEAV